MKTVEPRSPAPVRRAPSGPRSEAKRARILETAMRHFAERGYHAARIEDIATELSIAKGSVFQHFGSKEGLFLVAYQKAVSAFSAYLDAPAPVLAGGFFETLRYWLERTDRHGARELDSLPGRSARELRDGPAPAAGDQSVPAGARTRTARPRSCAWESTRGEVRPDIDEEMIVSLLDWTVERFQDALLTEELDPGLFSRQGKSPEKTAARIGQFLELLRCAVGTPIRRPSREARAARRPEEQ